MTSGPNPESTQMSYKVKNEPTEGKGTKPIISEASSILEVFTSMVLHVCKKILFFDTSLRIALYLGGLIYISLIADVLVFPTSYFTRRDNMFNLYFVNIGWVWILFITVPYVILTSYTTCCGKWRQLVTAHLTRILIAIICWYSWVTLFGIIETNYGRCNMRLFKNKKSCLENGYYWMGIDISVHCFFLIYSNLVMIEEARAINRWERIKDYIRDEKYSRSVDDNTIRTNPLKNFDKEELDGLSVSYEKVTPYVRGFLIALTVLQLLWDVMLVSTMMYYHIMLEKLVSGIIAILTWFVTYRVWYTIPSVLPNLPGNGIFKYNKEITCTPPPVHYIQ